MRIKSRKEFRAAQRQIEELQEILAEMRQKETPQSYAILCKSYVRRIRQIQREIEEYLGVRDIEPDKMVAGRAKALPPAVFQPFDMAMKYLNKRQQIFAKAVIKELRYYEAHKAEFLKKYRNKFVAIRNGEVIGIGDDSAKLMDEVWAEYGHVPILFKQVLEREPHYRLPNIKLAEI